MNIFGMQLKVKGRTIGKIILAILVLTLGLPLEGEASDDFFARLFGRKSWQTPQQGGANAQQAAQAAEREKAAIKAAAEKEEAEKKEAARQAREKAIAERMAFEKEAAQKQIAQREEDERRAATRQQQQAQPQIQQPIQPTPQTQAHQEGKSFASSLMAGVIEAAKSANPHLVPGFQTDKPKESSLDVGTIGDAALAESRTNEVSQHLASQAQKRQNFKIDPNTDPLFVEANQVINNPQKAISEEVREVLASEEIKEEIRTCEEGGDEYQQSCSKRLEIVLKITPEQGYRTPKWCIEHWANKRTGRKYKCAGCRGGDYVITQYKKVDVASEEWTDGCAVLEDLVDKGLCRYVSASRSTQNETRTIQGEPITRDHFEEHYQFACSKAPTTQVSPNSCAGLREQGCYQIDSKCKEGDGNYCFLWQQTYACPSGRMVGKSYRSSNTENSAQTSLFCLTGNCADTSYEANNELLNVMSHLSVLREAQNDLKNFAVIFKGQQRACTRNLWDFRDCCGSGKGWGVTLHLSDCDKAEIELRTLRDKNLCVQVGTYCAEKHLGQCTRKKTTFCCYGTKLARLIQENGRAQLGMGFGNPEHPNCEGLSPEQLSRIDFSRINFSEIFEDIKNHTVAKDQKQSLAQVSTERLQNNMTLLTKPPLDQTSIEERQKLKEKGL